MSFLKPAWIIPPNLTGRCTRHFLMAYVLHHKKRSSTVWTYKRPGRQSRGFSFTKLLNFLILFLILGIMSSVGIPAAIISNFEVKNREMEPYARSYVSVRKKSTRPSMPILIKRMGFNHRVGSEPKLHSGVTKTVSLGNHESALKPLIKKIK